MTREECIKNLNRVVKIVYGGRNPCWRHNIDLYRISPICSINNSYFKRIGKKCTDYYWLCVKCKYYHDKGWMNEKDLQKEITKP